MQSQYFHKILEAIFNHWISSQFCKQKGGWLAEIKSSSDQAALGSILQSNINYWIGLTDTAVKGKWVWQHSNLKVGPWTNWEIGQPDNCGESKMCAEIWNIAGKWVWNDVNCAGQNNRSCHYNNKLPLCQIPKGLID